MLPIEESVIELVFILGSQSGRIITLDKPGDYTFGRDAGCDIRIEETDVSRFHGRFVWNGTILTIEDLRSKNGIYLNGEKIICYKVESGDIIDIGSFTFQVNIRNRSEVQSLTETHELSHLRALC